MPEYLAPGVYVEEVDTGPKPIEGVSTSTSGVVGVTERGPANVATLVTGFADYRRQFGGYLDRRTFTGDTWYLPHAVEGFFTNGGKRLYVTRVCAEKAATAKATLFNRGSTPPISTLLAAPSRIDDTALLVLDETGMNAGGWLKVDDGSATEYVQVCSLTAKVMALRGSFHFPHALDSHVNIVTTKDVDVASDPITLTKDCDPGKQEIFVSSVADIPISATAPAILLLEDAGSVIREYVIVQNTDAATNKVTLKYALNFKHSNLRPVKIVSITTPPTSQTKLAIPVYAGEALLSVTNSNTAGFAADALIEIVGATPDQTEYQTIDSVLGAVLSSPAVLGYPVGQSVQFVTTADGVTPRTLSAKATAGGNSITLSDVNMPGATAFIKKGTVLRIGLDTDAKREYVIASADADTTTKQVTLRDTLAFDHDEHTDVRDVTLTVTANSATTIASRLNPGEKILLLVNKAGLTGYAPDAIVGITDATSNQTEYRVLEKVSAPGAVLLGAPPNPPDTLKPQSLQFSHLPGAALFGRDPLLMVQAIDCGAWGNCLRVSIEDDEPILDTTTKKRGNPGDPTLQLRTAVGIEPGTILDIGYVKNTDGTITPGSLQKVTSVNGNLVSFGPGGLAAVADWGVRVRTREFKLTVTCIQVNPSTGKPQVAASETQRQLSMDPRHSHYVVTTIGPIFHQGMKRRLDGRTEGLSDWIRVEDSLADPLTGVLDEATAEAALRLGPDLVTETLPGRPTRPVALPLSGGDDQVGSITDETYIGVEDLSKSYPDDRTGLFSLKRVEEISIVAIPGRTSQHVQEELINQCELLRYRFAVLDSEKIATRSEITVPEVQENRSLFDTKYAALYYPWLRITDPFPENPQVPGQVSIPPSGHIMGIYARSDIERGVHKAPANEVIRGIQDLALKITKEEQDMLNPRNINVLRNFRENNRGLRVWGARTLSSDPDWKYVNVRRLFIFIEHSIDRGTQWVVFEPNAEPLWERVRRVVSAFLTSVWRDGALMGKTPEEAYFVKVDRTTMTQYDIDNGRLIVMIGIAPVKPAEFVIFRIGQWAGGSELSEG